MRTRGRAAQAARLPQRPQQQRHREQRQPQGGEQGERRPKAQRMSATKPPEPQSEDESSGWWRRNPAQREMQGTGLPAPRNGDEVTSTGAEGTGARDRRRPGRMAEPPPPPPGPTPPENLLPIASAPGPRGANEGGNTVPDCSRPSRQ